jgi:hypothetical protein
LPRTEAPRGPAIFPGPLLRLQPLLYPPDRYRFDIGALAKDFSKNFFPRGEPFTEVIGADLEDREGALQPSTSGNRWGISYS